MRLLVLLLSVSAAVLTGCDKEGNLSLDTTPTPTPTPVPTPGRTSVAPTVAPKKNGDWMFDKNRGNPLEERPKRK